MIPCYIGTLSGIVFLNQERVAVVMAEIASVDVFAFFAWLAAMRCS